MGCGSSTGVMTPSDIKGVLEMQAGDASNLQGQSVPCLPCLLGTLPIAGATCGHMRVRSGQSRPAMRVRDGLTVRRIIQGS